MFGKGIRLPVLALVGRSTGQEQRSDIENQRDNRAIERDQPTQGFPGWQVRKIVHVLQLLEITRNIPNPIESSKRRSRQNDRAGCGTRTRFLASLRARLSWVFLNSSMMRRS